VARDLFPDRRTTEPPPPWLLGLELVSGVAEGSTNGGARGIERISVDAVAPMDVPARGSIFVQRDALRTALSLVQETQRREVPTPLRVTFPAAVVLGRARRLLRRCGYG
jgi:hypothetical protein